MAKQPVQQVQAVILINRGSYTNGGPYTNRFVHKLLPISYTKWI